MSRPGIKYQKLNKVFSKEEDVVLPKPSQKRPELRRNDVSVERMVRGESDCSLEKSKSFKRERDTLIHEAAFGGAVVMNTLRKTGKL